MNKTENAIKSSKLDTIIIYLIAIQIFLKASFFNMALIPGIDLVGSSSFGIHDLFFFLLLLAIFVKLISGDRNGLSITTPVVFLLLFLVFGAFGIINAVMGETSFHLAAKEARGFFLYLIFYGILSLIPNKSNFHKIIFLTTIIASLTSVISFLQVILPTQLEFLSGKTLTLRTMGHDIEGVTRIGTNGMPTITFLFFYWLINLFQKINLKNIFFTILLSIGIFISFSRGTWLAIILSILSVFPFVGGSVRKSFIVFFSVSFLLGILVLPVALYGFLGTKIQTYVTSGVDRFTSLTPTNLANDGSTQGRIKESKLIFEKALSRPIIGHGLGAVTQKNFMSLNDKTGYHEKIQSWGYVHNGYLYIFFKLGLTGLFLFLVYIFSILIRSIKMLKHIKDIEIKPAYLGSSLFLLAMIPASITNARIMEDNYIIIIAVTSGLMELSRKLDIMGGDLKK